MNDVQVYKTLLNQWYNQYQTLYDILNLEQNALEKRDFTKLGSLTKEKIELIKTINQHQIPSVITSTTSSQPKINQVKIFCINSLELKDQWGELMELVEKCNFKNDVNSRLIELVTTSTKRIFNLIKGFDPDNNLYNSSGNRTLVKHYGEPLSA